MVLLLQWCTCIARVVLCSPWLICFLKFRFATRSQVRRLCLAGNNPKHVMIHLSKVFQAIDRLTLDEKGGRPVGKGVVSCVGTETCEWTSPLTLEGKVEQYMNSIIDKMRSELKAVLFQSVKAYPTKPRTKWQFDWPSQVILVVNQIFWCQEVEEAFGKMKSSKNAMRDYNKKQVQQLTDLIQVTRTQLAKPDRQKVMNMITIDAHSRDMIEQIADSGSDDVESFQWVCQLRTYWDKSIDDCRIRICDASFPYGYEYLGNGPRLVITPLTDRIYITATQARTPPICAAARNLY
jgi:dynein heavy chain, axonemal